ncbi:hypothetical protein DMC30DRAFT_149217 [Rhodotorula diobovata]|uniref:Uncharacterized protein n=1 Tax=Rhodotorula diobovata TaxID=5288 RepID=A0A5C5FZU3_9BASI|nr:hypothetical protein DMC30DRAFT_149217 [Rhodotorula diobovata]
MSSPRGEPVALDPEGWPSGLTWADYEQTARLVAQHAERAARGDRARQQERRAYMTKWLRGLSKGSCRRFFEFMPASFRRCAIETVRGYDDLLTSWHEPVPDKKRKRKKEKNAMGDLPSGWVLLMAEYEKWKEPYPDDVVTAEEKAEYESQRARAAAYVHAVIEERQRERAGPVRFALAPLFPLECAADAELLNAASGACRLPLARAGVPSARATRGTMACSSTRVSSTAQQRGLPSPPFSTTPPRTVGAAEARWSPRTT